MNTNQDKASAKNLDFPYLETHLGANNWLTPILRNQVTSTNDVVTQNFDQIQPGSGIAVIADEQTQGRGRLDRNWSTPAGSGIAMSLGVSASDFDLELSVVPLICGIATYRALRKLKVPVELKWPNDIVFVNSDQSESPLKKVGGILVQLINDKLIIGIGLNISLSQDELPVPNATSLAIEGYEIEREYLIVQVIEELNILRNENSQWLAEYENACASLNKQVRVVNSDGSEIIGRAISIEKSGAINVESLENLYQITVGDIEHLQVLAD